MADISIDVPHSLIELEQFVIEREKTTPHIKTGTQAKIVWTDAESKSRTPFSIVYLHGFKASHGEGDPLHKRIAASFGCNLYLSRLEKHGLDDQDAFSMLESGQLIRSAIRAFQIGERLGKKVVLMGTSTGASLALYLAGREPFNHSIECLILYSPLISFYGIQSYLLGTKTGRKLLQWVPGKDFQVKSKPFSEEESRIWYNTYRLQGALALGEFVQQYMTRTAFSTITCPVFTGYYYKDRKKQDKIVSVGEIKKMHHHLGTAKEKKRLVNFPGAGSHVICSGLLSNSVHQVEKETSKFLQQIAGLQLLP